MTERNLEMLTEIARSVGREAFLATARDGGVFFVAEPTSGEGGAGDLASIVDAFDQEIIAAAARAAGYVLPGEGVFLAPKPGRGANPVPKGGCARDVKVSLKSVWTTANDSRSIQAETRRLQDLVTTLARARSAAGSRDRGDCGYTESAFEIETEGMQTNNRVRLPRAAADRRRAVAPRGAAHGTGRRQPPRPAAPR